MHRQPGYPNNHTSQPISPQGIHTFPLEAPSSFFPQSNDSPYQWQKFVSRSGLPSWPPSFIDSPPLIVESSRCSAGPGHSGHLCHPIQPPTNLLYPIPNYSNSHLYLEEHGKALISCLWLLNGAPCGFTGSLDRLKTHCASSHFAGRRDMQFKCQWEGCHYHKRDDPTVNVMRRDSMWRHVLEVHLGVKRGT